MLRHAGKRFLTLHHNRTFFTTQRNGGPPWSSDELEAKVSSETTLHVDNESDYEGQMVSGDCLGVKQLDICLKGEEKSRENLTQKTCPDRGSYPGPQTSFKN